MSPLVVSDTGPLQYLVLCGSIDVLPKLFSRVVIPSVVRRELSHVSAPAMVRNWMEIAPTWAEIKSPIAPGMNLNLGAGETEAIALALELQAGAILLDDQKARMTANRMGLRVVGTLAILESASKNGLLDLKSAIAMLRRTNFRISPRLLEEALERHRRQLS